MRVSPCSSRDWTLPSSWAASRVSRWARRTSRHCSIASVDRRRPSRRRLLASNGCASSAWPAPTAGSCRACREGPVRPRPLARSGRSSGGRPGPRPLGPAAAWLHVVRARINTNQGRPEDAARHLATARSLMDGMSRSRSYLPALLAAEAELAASRGDLGAAWAVAEQALASVRSGGTLDPALGWVVWHVIRAEADAASSPGDRGRRPRLTPGGPR